MISTARLILRHWREADRAPYAALMADQEVAYWLGGAISRAEADRQIDRIEERFVKLGFGRFAIERTSDGRFLGLCGLAPVGLPAPAPQGLELAWRLARHAWGHGYATEAARAVVLDGFGHLGATELFAFTAEINARSIGVMERCGFLRDPNHDFDHPDLATGDPLRRHIVYRIGR